MTKPSEKILEAPLMDVKDFDNSPPVHDSAIDIVNFLFIKLLTNFSLSKLHMFTPLYKIKS